MNCEKLVARWTFCKYFGTMRSQLGLFPRAAGLAISLASERSKSFKVRRAGFAYGRAEKTRARGRDGARTRVKLDFQTALGELRVRERGRVGRRERESSLGSGTDLFRSPRLREIYVQAPPAYFYPDRETSLRDFARGKPIGGTAGKFTVKPFLSRPTELRKEYVLRKSAGFSESHREKIRIDLGFFSPGCKAR